MQRGKNQMTGFGCLQGKTDRFAVAHFAHHHNVRVLAKRNTKSGLETGRMKAYFALAHHAAEAFITEFNGILNREDVFAAMLVRIVDKSGRHGRLATAGRAHKEHETAVEHGKLSERIGKSELFERRNGIWNFSESGSRSGERLKDIHTVACKSGNFIT